MEHRDYAPLQAIEALGQNCTLPGALSSSLYLLHRFQGEPVEALIANALAGGDSASRGLVLGALLGAEHGEGAFPIAWRNALRGRDRLERALRKVIATEGSVAS